MGSTMRAYWASQIFLIWLTLLGVVGVVCADVLGDISCHNGTIRDSMTSGHVYCTLRAEEHGNQAPTSLGSLSIESYEDGKGDERRRFFTLLLGHGDVGRQAPLRSGFASLFQYFGPPHEGQYSQSKITSSYINWVTSSYRQSHGVTVSSVGAEKTNDASTSATSWWTLPLRGIRHGIVQMKRLIWSGICYPWWRPTAMYDIFAQREIHIQFPIVNVDGANLVAGRAAPSRLQIFRTGRLQRLRLISYLPVPQSNILPDGRTEKTIFHCDVNAIREAHQWMDSRQVRQSWQDVNTDAIEGDGHVMDEAFPNEGDVGRSIPDASSLPKWMLSWLRRRTSRVSRDAEWMTDLASKAYLDHVVEELGPHAAPPSPSLLRYAQRLTGRRILRTLTYLAATDDDEGTSSPRYVFHFSASLPAVSSICFSMEATASSLRLGGSGAASHPLDLEVTVDTHLHWSWLQKLLLFGIIVMAFPQMEQSRILHVIFAGFFGMFVLTVLCISYIFRSIQKMSVGKAGVLAILIAGGVTAVVEGVVSASAQVLTEVQDQYSQDIVLYALILVLLLSLLSSALIRCLVPTYMLHVGVKGCLYLVIALLLGFLFAENREATVVTMGTAACVFIIAQVSRRWMPPSTRESGPWKRRSLQMIDSLLPESSTARWKAALKDGVRHAPPFVQRIIERCGSTNGYDLNGEPDDDDNPRKFAAVAYATPIVEEGRHYQRAGQLKHGSTRGANDRSRNVMQQYEKEGAEHTRLALEQLAAHLRSNPGRYADRLRDPNGVQRWAGEADTESDTSDASD